MTEIGFVVVGRVVGVHGLRGQIRVHCLGDGPAHLLELSEAWLGRARDDARARHFEIGFAGTGRRGEVRLALEGVSDREAAAQLRGLLVLARPEQLAPLPEGEFYWHQVVGCTVVGRDGGEIGTVVEIWETGAHDVMVVRGPSGERHLLSTARELMPEIDLESRRIVVESIPGMLDPLPS